jgi:hypothetical protein
MFYYFLSLFDAGEFLLPLLKKAMHEILPKQEKRSLGIFDQTENMGRFARNDAGTKTAQEHSLIT